MLAVAGKLGPDGWRFVPQLPFELAACPFWVFQWVRLPVVSYALPALIAIGRVRHHHRPTWFPPWRWLRNAVGAMCGRIRASAACTSAIVIGNAAARAAPRGALIGCA